ncbi:MAG: CHASE domain-containing protein [Magnetococcus sp. DMHC-6]
MNVTPLSRHRFFSNLSPFFQEYGLLFLVAVVGVLFSVVIFFGVRMQMSSHIQQEFEWVAQDRQRAVYRGLETALESIYDLHDLFHSSATVSGSTFHRIASLILSRHTGVEVLQWVPVVDHDQRENFEAQNAMIDPSFRIYDFSLTPPFTVATPRKQYAPVTYLEPAHAPFRWLGLDYFSDTNSRKLFADARDSGEIRVSGRIPAHWEKASLQFRFLAVYPVYNQDLSVETILERRQALRGFVVGVFQFAHLAQRSISMLEPRGVEFKFLCLPSDEIFH